MFISLTLPDVGFLNFSPFRFNAHKYLKNVWFSSLLTLVVLNADYIKISYLYFY